MLSGSFVSPGRNQLSIPFMIKQRMSAAVLVSVMCPWRWISTDDAMVHEHGSGADGEQSRFRCIAGKGMRAMADRHEEEKEEILA
jgi:hypothetical protein